MESDRLREILDKHAEWLMTRFTSDTRGERANLYGADLCDADLYGADLRDANLRGANLYGANLYGANLRGANLYGANLYGANLCDANLCDANLYGADLRDANLCDANLYGADLRDANLCDANLYGANLRGNIYLAGVLVLDRNSGQPHFTDRKTAKSGFGVVVLAARWANFGQRLHLRTGIRSWQKNILWLRI